MGQMKMYRSHMAAAANAEAMFSCANIALILDTMILVSIFVVLVSLLSLIRLSSLTALLALLAILILKTTPAPKDRYRCFG